MRIHLSLIPERYAVARLSLRASIPAAVLSSDAFYSFSKSAIETSLLCKQNLLPLGVEADRDWRIFRFTGSMDMRLIGVVSTIAKPLSDNNISMIAITTYDAGYFGVKAQDVENAIFVLEATCCVIDQKPTPI